MFGSESYDSGLSNDEEFIFNEFHVDDTLSALGKLKKYRRSDFHLQRLNLVRGLYDTVHEAGIEKCYDEDVVDMIQSFVNDGEQSVRKEVAEQLYPVAIFFLENGNYQKGYETLKEKFIPFAFELVIDKKLEVSEAGTRALVQIANLVHQNDVERDLFIIIQKLARDGEEQRAAAAKILNKLSPIFGEELCCQKVVPELTKLSRDLSLSVRKAVAQSLDKICPIVGRAITVERILPFYIGLCRDDIWGVRKACAESLCVISKHVTPKERIQNLTPLFTQLCSDSSRWVKIEMLRQLGRFVSTFKKEPWEDEVANDFEVEILSFKGNKSLDTMRQAGGPTKKVNLKSQAMRKRIIREARERHRRLKNKEEDVPRVLLKYFNDMSYSGDNMDSDLVEFCAYAFPAVVETVGKRGWPYIAKSYYLLVKDMQWKVRRTLSWSLVRIAKVLLKPNDSEDQKKEEKKVVEEEEYEDDFDFDERSQYYSSVRDDYGSFETSVLTQLAGVEFERKKKRKILHSRKEEKKRGDLFLSMDRPYEGGLVKSAGSFLRDIDDVKLGVVSSLAEFMKMVSSKHYDEFLKIMSNIIKDSENWRIKQKIAEQLSSFLGIFCGKGKKTQHYLWRKKVIRLYRELMRDDFAIIRDSTAKETGNILKQLVIAGDADTYKEVMKFVCELAVNEKKKGNWMYRMLYLTVCKYLVRETSPEVFEMNFMKLLLQLAKGDECVNVQIMAAKILCEEISQTDQWKNDHRIIKIINQLKNHEDPDVNFMANQSIVNYNSALQNLKITELILSEDKLARAGSSDLSVTMMKNDSSRSVKRKRRKN